MPQFRKKPVVIEACRMPHRDETGHWPQWLLKAVLDGVIVPHDTDAGGATIKTLEGDMFAHADDWIIKGVKGELYPCKPDVFAATYDPA